jgi:hypothetical protein
MGGAERYEFEKTKLIHSALEQRFSVLSPVP